MSGPMFDDLLNIMRFTSPGMSGADAKRVGEEMKAAFCQRWAQEDKFVAYFQERMGPEAGWGTMSYFCIALAKLVCPKKRDLLSLPSIAGMTCVGAGMIMQVYRDLAKCAINCTSHVEGWHMTLKVRFLCCQTRVKNSVLATTTTFKLQYQIVLRKLQGLKLCCVGAQYCFLSGRRRLTNRRIDWLLWILHTKVAEYYQFRMQEQDLGVQKNLQSYRSIKNAITKADSQPDTSVTVVGGEAQVTSATAAGVTHKLQLTEERGPQCTCPAGNVGKICWHVVKVLLHLGASKNQLLWYLGTLDGAVGGGFKGLQSAMDGSWEAGSSGGGGETVASAALPEVPAVLSSDHMELDGASDPTDSSIECALTKPSAEVRGRSKAAAQSAVAALTNMSLSWEDDSPNWKFLLVAARHAKDKVERAQQALTPSRMSQALSWFPIPMHGRAHSGRTLWRLRQTSASISKDWQPMRRLEQLRGQRLRTAVAATQMR